MLILENIRMAFTSLLANKSRAILTMLGIIIGIASVIAIKTVGNSLTASLSSEMQSIGAGNITVYLNRKEAQDEEGKDGVNFGTVQVTREITRDDMFSDELIRSMLEEFGDRIVAVSVSDDLETASVKWGSESTDINVMGVSAGYFVANDMTILAGTGITPELIAGRRNAIVVADTFCEKLLGLSPEEAVGVVFSTRVMEQPMDFTIVGVYERQDNYGGGIFSVGEPVTEAYIPLSTSQTVSHRTGYAVFELVAAEGEDPNGLQTEVKDYLNGYYRTNALLEVQAYNMASLVESLGAVMDTTTTAISIIAGIALLVGGIGVMNIMLVSITERTREIGTRKALGATNASIRIQFITESMIICLIGGMIGVALGIGLGALGAHLMGYPAKASMGSIFGSLFFSLGIGVFFGFYPAEKAARMNPIEALRYE